MFNNTLKTSALSKQSKSLQQKILTHHSFIKTTNKYYTPYKSNLTTLNTNNNTLSLYSNYSKNQAKKFFSQIRQANTINSNKSSINKSVKNKKSSALKNKEKMQKKTSGKIPKKTASLQTSKNDNSKIKDKIASNKQLYKQLRQSINYQSTSLLLSKISEIFDLVLQKVKLPYEIQTFLFRPLQVLRKSLEEKGRYEISETLTEFKNNCLNIFKASSSSQVALFQRMQLPRNNRWLASTVNNVSVVKKERQLQERLASFQNLKKKGELCDHRENEALSRIENRLDDYLCKSVKYRKVYL